MDRVIYLAMKAADRFMTAQTMHANNLSNASSSGFKAELDYFTDEPLAGPGYDSVNNPLTKKTYADFSAGSIITTGRDLDIAMHGDTWLAVQGDDQQEAYTRHGELEVSAEGFLQTQQGHLVLGAGGGPISIPPEQSIDIAENGAVSVRPLGAPAEQLVIIGNLKLVNATRDDILKSTDGLFRTLDQQPLEESLQARVVPRALEGSNVNLVGELVQLMENSRNFEMQVKLMQAADENDTKAASLMAMR